MRFTTLLSVAFAAAAATPAFALPTNTFASRTVEDDSVYAREYDSDLWARRDPRPGLPPQKPVPTYPPPAPPTGGRHRRSLQDIVDELVERADEEDSLWARDAPKPRPRPRPRPIVMPSQKPVPTYAPPSPPSGRRRTRSFDEDLWARMEVDELD